MEECAEINNKALSQQIEKIYEIMLEIQNTQKEQIELIKKHNATYMKKIDKLQEYNKIADMTNQVFEKRLNGIECAIKELNKGISA